MHDLITARTECRRRCAAEVRRLKRHFGGSTPREQRAINQILRQFHVQHAPPKPTRAGLLREAQEAQARADYLRRNAETDCPRVCGADDAYFRALDEWAEHARACRAAARTLRTCDYCGEAPAEGYVPAYRAHVCEPCFEDHHGPIL